MVSSPIRLLLDQGLPRDAATQLRDIGLLCTHVGEIGMHAAADPEILDWAMRNVMVVVTLDADFHTILAITNATSPSVIRVRLQGLNAAEIVNVVRSVLDRYTEELEAGCMITVKARKTTCRMLQR